MKKLIEGFSSLVKDITGQVQELVLLLHKIDSHERICMSAWPQFLKPCTRAGNFSEIEWRK